MYITTVENRYKNKQKTSQTKKKEEKKASRGNIAQLKSLLSQHTLLHSCKFPKGRASLISSQGSFPRP